MNYFSNSLSLRLYELPYLFVVLMISFTLHEFAHAGMAKCLGDSNPQAEGRLSLNPLRHIDYQGFFLMLLVGVGWTNPVDINENNYRNSNDYTLVILAGPLMNLLLAVLAIVSFPLLSWVFETLLSHNNNSTLILRLWSICTHFLSVFLQVNIFFLIFNLLPLPNLDGFHLWRQVLGNPRWFFEIFGNPLVNILLLIGIIYGLLPIAHWGYFITRGLINVMGNFLPLF